MKATFIALLALVVAVGCGGKEQPTDTKQGNNTPKKSAKKKVGKEAQTKTKVTEPVKELTLEEKVVGEYENKLDGNAERVVLLGNGIFEYFYNGKKRSVFKWKISKEGELHATYPNGHIAVFRINKDGSITQISYIPKDGKRKDVPKDAQRTLKKIK